ncbi:MAG: hypothetical protein HY297_01580 [Thaumarchaeota archaeon]|nr:hypothetical protein [Nitrososphaerota archaeon]
MKSLRPGKLPIPVLDRTVLRMTGAPSELLRNPPRAGQDFAAIRMGKGFLIVSSDPITGASSDAGLHAIMVNANDVATSGNRPQFVESVVLLPEGSDEADLRRIAGQMDGAARKLGISIVGGHTEVTPGLDNPIISVTAFSFVDRYVTSADAREGDAIMMTKTAGIEGTAALAGELWTRASQVKRTALRRAGLMREKLSVVEEAVRACATGKVHAMHDCTEGGLEGAVYEMSVASGLGFSVDEGLVPVAPETRALCDALSLDPMKLIASGSLLLSVAAGGEGEVRESLRGVCKVTRVGGFMKAGRYVVSPDGKESRMKAAPEDELWRALSILRRG